MDMTEHDKMRSGKIYDPFSENMPEERAKAHRLCQLYNQIPDTETEKREELLNELMPDHDSGVYLQGPIFFDFGKNISMGKNSYANFNFTVLDEGEVRIGSNVFIGPGVSLLTAIHPLCFEDRNYFFNPESGHITNFERTGRIEIGDNCWIGGSVTIIGNVTIGEGSVIGAGSVVTKDIPPHSLAYGVPCRAVRAITEDDRIKNHPEFLAQPEDMRYFEFLPV